MDKPFESSIIEMTTLCPLFIMGKDIEYGEGMLRGSGENDKDFIYLINNDRLCEYIESKNKIDEYIDYLLCKLSAILKT